MLNGSASTDPDGTIVSYAWDWIPPLDGNPPEAVGAVVNVTAAVQVLAPGHYDVLLRVTDNAGGTAAALGGIDVYSEAECPLGLPNEPPTVNVPAAVTAEATGAVGAAVAFAATVSDPEDGTSVPACTPSTGSTFPLGETTVTCTAVDAGRLAAEGTFTITVIDTTPPLVSGADVIAEATGPGGATVEYVAAALDLVDGAIAPACAPASGSLFALGATTVSCSATDAQGNMGYGSFTVTVVDSTAPTVSGFSLVVPPMWPPDGTLQAVTVNYSATDACGPGVTCVLSVSSNQPQTGLGNSDVGPDWVIVDNYTVKLRREYFWTVPRIYTITLTCTDASGNQTVNTATVVVTRPL
jgi:hypothetical protein